jgi:type II secretion system protein G
MLQQNWLLNLFFNSCSMSIILCYTKPMKENKSGFTIVELLIVIVVIGILASITIVAYNGIQDRATKARRLSDMNTITKALEVYKAQTGSYPQVVSNSTGGWERSAVNPQNFLQALRTSGVIASVPVDPINSAPQGSTGPETTFTSYTYYLYPAGSFSCDAALGAMYVLKIEAPGVTGYAESPGMKCGNTVISGTGGGTNTPYFSGRTTN